VIALVVGGVAWTRTQYYVGFDGDEVAVFQGVPATLGPVSLSTVAVSTGITTDEIESQYVRDRLDQTIHAADRAAALRLVDQLVVPEPVDEPTPEPTVTPTPSPTAAPSPAPTPKKTAPATPRPTARATAGTDG
jgi:PPM family protein phosphatase